MKNVSVNIYISKITTSHYTTPHHIALHHTTPHNSALHRVMKQSKIKQIVQKYLTQLTKGCTIYGCSNRQHCCKAEGFDKTQVCVGVGVILECVTALYIYIKYASAHMRVCVYVNVCKSV
jgi:hypothetical protein